MDSTLILEYVEAFAGNRNSLMPSGTAERQRTLRVIGLALAGCEKCLQIVHERKLRSVGEPSASWVARFTGQLLAAYEALESELRRRPLTVTSRTIDQAGITAAVAWYYTQRKIPDVVPAANFPSLQMLSHQAEALPEFAAAPYGSETCRHVV